MTSGRANAPLVARRFDLPDGATLPYVELGDPAGPPLLAIPGLSDGLAPVSDAHALAALRPPADAFAGFRILWVSYREPLSSEPTTEQAADDLSEFVRSVVGGPVAVYGHSMGGMTAQHLAARHPDLVDRLVLIATVTWADPGFARIIQRWADLLANGRWRAFNREAFDVSFRGTRHAPLRRLLLALAKPPSAAAVERHLRLTRACLTHDARSVLDRVEAPTLVVGGALDPLAPPASIDELVGQLRQARRVVLPRAAHGLAEEHSRVHAAVVLDFLGAPPSGPVRVDPH